MNAHRAEVSAEGGVHLFAQGAMQRLAVAASGSKTRGSGWRTAACKTFFARYEPRCDLLRLTL